MIEWLKQLPKQDRKREVLIASKNAMDIFMVTGDDQWKTLAIEVEKLR